MYIKITEKDYLNYFNDCNKKEKALLVALDTRKFEIDLYWKRATYFWAFIAATFAAYGAIQASEIPHKQDYTVLLSCLGIVFSFAWYSVNRASKQWQENWENHVDLLEDDITGPLYKIVLQRQNSDNIKGHILSIFTGPLKLSVSKINQIISLYMFLIWIFILFKSLQPFSFVASLNWEYIIIIFFTFLTCYLFIKIGKTFQGSLEHNAFKRESNIII